MKRFQASLWVFLAVLFFGQAAQAVTSVSEIVFGTRISTVDWNTMKVYDEGVAFPSEKPIWARVILTSDTKVLGTTVSISWTISDCTKTWASGSSSRSYYRDPVPFRVKLGQLPPGSYTLAIAVKEGGVDQTPSSAVVTVLSGTPTVSLGFVRIGSELITGYPNPNKQDLVKIKDLTVTDSLMFLCRLRELSGIDQLEVMVEFDDSAAKRYYSSVAKIGFAYQEEYFVSITIGKLNEPGLHYAKVYVRFQASQPWVLLSTTKGKKFELK